MTRSPKILFTAFRPFAGRAVNGSETIAGFLETMKAPFIIQTLVMDVAWGAVEKTGLAAVTDFCPDMILALGEGGPDIVAIETAAVNHRTGIDNSGRNTDCEIEPGAPATRRSRFAFSFRNNAAYRYPVTISGDAGRFLCNNALYSFLGSPAPRAVLLHIPPQGKTGNAEYARAILPFVNDLLQSNFPGTSSPFPG